MVGAEAETTTAAGNKAIDTSIVDSKATVVAVEITTAASVAAVNNKKTNTEKSNHVNLRNIGGCTDAIVAPMDSNARAKI